LTPIELALSDAPLALIYNRATGDAPVIISIIGSFAVINGALIQLIMASRLFYGMANKHWLPPFLAKIHPRTQTPINSTILTVVLMLFFALTFDIVELAEITSYLVLFVFAMVNLALIKIKQKKPVVKGAIVFPVWLPRLGFLTSMSLLMIKIISGFF
jgi:amino acid transporter